MRRRRAAGARAGPPVGDVRLLTRLPRRGVDFASEGLLDGLDGEARAARLELLERLHAEGATLDELRAAVADGLLVFLLAPRPPRPRPPPPPPSPSPPARRATARATSRARPASRSRSSRRCAARTAC